MSRAGLTSYPIGKSQRTCAATGRRLAPGERFIAALVEGDDGQMARLDFSAESWEGPARPVDKSHLIGFWRGVVGPETESPRQVLDNETLLDLFDQAPADQPSRAGLRFVLALMLVRRRLLVHEATRNGAMLLRRTGEARPPEGPPLLEVHDPGLSEATIAEVIAELEDLCRGGRS